MFCLARPGNPFVSAASWTCTNSPLRGSGDLLGTAAGGVRVDACRSDAAINLSKDRLGASNCRALIGGIEPIKGGHPIPLRDCAPFKRCDLQPRIGDLWIRTLANAMVIHLPEQQGSPCASPISSFLKYFFALAKSGSTMSPRR